MYFLKNIGNIAPTNITVQDDNGTPNNPADKFVVGTVARPARGASATLAATASASLRSGAHITLRPRFARAAASQLNIAQTMWPVSPVPCVKPRHAVNAGYCHAAPLLAKEIERFQNRIAPDIRGDAKPPCVSPQRLSLVRLLQ